MAPFLKTCFDNIAYWLNLNTTNPFPHRTDDDLGEQRRQYTGNRSGPSADSASSTRQTRSRTRGGGDYERSGASNTRHHQQNRSQNEHRGAHAQPTYRCTMNNSSSNSNRHSTAHANRIPSDANRNTQQTATTDKLDIKDVRDITDINNLGARQLKTILSRNCVDYKGVFEKEVLREKVMQLWIDHNERKAKRRKHSNQTSATRPTGSSQDSSDDVDYDQLCKICMAEEINCVLLECGHYLTCLDCGKKLAECPICRQNVVRCVRTFKG